MFGYVWCIIYFTLFNCNITQNGAQFLSFYDGRPPQLLRLMNCVQPIAGTANPCVPVIGSQLPRK